MNLSSSRVSILPLQIEQPSCNKLRIDIKKLIGKKMKNRSNAKRRKEKDVEHEFLKTWNTILKIYIQKSKIEMGASMR